VKNSHNYDLEPKAHGGLAVWCGFAQPPWHAVLLRAPVRDRRADARCDVGERGAGAMQAPAELALHDGPRGRCGRAGGAGPRPAPRRPGVGPWPARARRQVRAMCVRTASVCVSGIPLPLFSAATAMWCLVHTARRTTHGTYWSIVSRAHAPRHATPNTLVLAHGQCGTHWPVRTPYIYIYLRDSPVQLNQARASHLIQWSVHMEYIIPEHNI
jgi:hypothetical protein